MVATYNFGSVYDDVQDGSNNRVGNHKGFAKHIKNNRLNEMFLSLF